jgi:predicted secreted protein
MKQLLTFILGLIFLSGTSQIQLEINGFSNQYKGILTIQYGFEESVFKEGNISIIDLNTNKKIISINSDEFF